MSYISGTQSVFPIVAAVCPGSLLEVQTLGPAQIYWTETLEGEAQKSVFEQALQVMLKLENPYLWGITVAS